MKVTSHPTPPADEDVLEVLVTSVGWQECEPGSYVSNKLYAHWIDPNRQKLRTVALTEIVGFARTTSALELEPS